MINYLKGNKNLFLSTLSLYILLSVGFALLRIVNIDEGLHLLYAREILEGKTPYQDFFFPQMPLILYLLSPFADKGLNGYFAARLLYAAFGLLLGLAIFSYSRERTNDLQVSLLSFILYTFNGFILSWHTVLQFNAPTDLLLFLAFWSSLKGKPIYLFLSGLLLGVVLSLRIVFLPLFLLFFVWLIVEKRGRDTLGWLVGWLLASSFWLLYLFKYKSVFLFNVLLSQLRRKDLFLPIAHPLFQKCLVLGKFLGFPQTGGITILALVSIIYLRRRLKDFKPELLAFLIGTTIFLTYLLATPSMFHYFVQTLPFFLIVSLPYLKSLIQRRRRLIYTLLPVYAIFLVVPIALHILGIREHDKTWKVENIRRAVSWIDKNSEEGEEIFSSWPGFPVLAKRGIPPRAKPWDKELAKRLGKEEGERYNIPSNEEMGDLIEGGKARVVIVTREDSKEWGVGKVYKERDRFGEFIGYLRPLAHNSPQRNPGTHCESPFLCPVVVRNEASEIGDCDQAKERL